MQSSKPVLSQEARNAIGQYARAAGISEDRAASEAIMGWMESTGYLVMEELDKRRKTRASKPKLTLV